VLLTNLVLPEELWRAGHVEVGVDAADGEVDQVGDEERAEDGELELVIADDVLLEVLGKINKCFYLFENIKHYSVLRH
jgi:hypothetical protein